MKKNLIAVIFGMIITVLLGLVSTPTRNLLGITHYGIPLSWRGRIIISPEFNPWRYNITNFIIDTLFWTIIIRILIEIIGPRIIKNN
jgi:hypothetical protein